jgi:hypothetical protein
VSDATDCDDTNSELNIDCNPTSVLNREVSFNVYPNPTSGLINIVSATPTPLTIEVYNVLSQKVASYKNVHKVDISHLENAVYYLIIVDEKGSVMKRIVKSE